MLIYVNIILNTDKTDCQNSMCVQLNYQKEEVLYIRHIFDIQWDTTSKLDFVLYIKTTLSA